MPEKTEFQKQFFQKLSEIEFKHIPPHKRHEVAEEIYKAVKALYVSILRVDPNHVSYHYDEYHSSGDASINIMSLWIFYKDEAIISCRMDQVTLDVFYDMILKTLWREIQFKFDYLLPSIFEIYLNDEILGKLQDPDRV